MLKSLLLVISAIGVIVTAILGWWLTYNALWNGNIEDGRGAFVCFALFNVFSLVGKLLNKEKL